MQEVSFLFNLNVIQKGGFGGNILCWFDFQNESYDCKKKKKKKNLRSEEKDGVIRRMVEGCLCEVKKKYYVFVYFVDFFFVVFFIFLF